MWVAPTLREAAAIIAARKDAMTTNENRRKAEDGPYRVEGYDAGYGFGMRYRAFGPNVVCIGHLSRHDAELDAVRLNRAWNAELGIWQTKPYG